jgi:hypothetical protein
MGWSVLACFDSSVGTDEHERPVGFGHNRLDILSGDIPITADAVGINGGLIPVDMEQDILQGGGTPERRR